MAIEPEPKGAVVYKKVWATDVVQQKLKSTRNLWLHDGRKLAWSRANVDQFSIKVDLGAAEGRAGRANNMFILKVRRSTKIRMESLMAYLRGQAAWSNSVLECVNFLDHAMRQGPSERMLQIKRSFFNENSETRRLSPFTEAIKGIYAAVRLNDSLSTGGIGLGINVDVTNQTFWTGQGLIPLVRSYLGALDRRWDNCTLDADPLLSMYVSLCLPMLTCVFFSVGRHAHQGTPPCQQEGRLREVGGFRGPEEAARPRL